MKMKQERNYHIQPAALDVSGHPVDVYPEVVFFLPGTNLRIWNISDKTIMIATHYTCLFGCRKD